MTRKSYDTLLSELSEARQYINVLIHDDTYGVVNAKAYPHEYRRVMHEVKNMAVVQVDPDHNPDKVKRAIHVRHPHTLLIAQPIKNHFVCLLSHDPESWCIRVKATMNKYNQHCITAWLPVNGNNPTLDFLTCLELIRLANPHDITDYLKEVREVSE